MSSHERKRSSSTEERAAKRAAYDERAAIGAYILRLAVDATTNDTDTVAYALELAASGIESGRHHADADR